MKILVTGGAGFIGSHLVDNLLDGGHKIIVIDNLNTGKLKNLPKHKDLTFIKASILDNIDKYFRGVDIVFHLAALTRPQYSLKHPKKVTRVNIEGTLNVLLACVKHKVRRVVLASTSSIYGTQPVYPVKESAIPYPESPYGLTKWVTELYAQLFQRTYGLEVNCIRPFNVYGSRQNPHGGYAAAVPGFINSLKNNKVDWITGDGEQSRDFTYIDDIVDIFIKAAFSRVFGESFNAGAGHNVTINYIYKTISKIMGKNIKPTYIDAVLEPRMTLADTRKAKRLLGWTAQTHIEDGLKKTIEEVLK